MTPEAINQAMARLAGLEESTTCPECYGSGFGGSEMDHIPCEMCGQTGNAAPYIPNLPNYTKDLNAVARVVGNLDLYQKHGYWSRLACIGPFECIDATAPQRCEAILSACGKWVEG